MTSSNQTLFEKSQQLIPGGVNSPVRAFQLDWGFDYDDFRQKKQPKNTL